MNELALGIDIGTSGVRTVAIDDAGILTGQSAAPIPAEWRRDPAAIGHAVEAALDTLARTLELAQIRAIAVDGTSGTLIVTDQSGQPVQPASLYNDRADPNALARIAAIAPADSAAHGSTSPLARILTLSENSQISHFLHEADWITHRLGGPLGVSDANNALKTGYDPITSAWPAWVKQFAFATRLPLVVEPGTSIGIVAPAIAARFGLAPTTRLIAGTTDGCASFLATGADQPGDGVTALGSTLTLKLLSDQPVFAPDYGIYSHRLLGNYLPGGASNAGAAVLARFFDVGRLVALSAAIDPSHDSGLDYYPLLAMGERFPINDPNLPPRLEPRPPDDAKFLHGLLEWLARIEALGYRRLAELGAPPVRRVLSVGGGASNPTWTALRARIIGVPVTAAPQAEAAYGTALLAKRGLAA